MKKLVYVLFFGLFLTACQQIAVFSTPPKKPLYSKSVLSKKAERYFWNTLHHGRYANIPQADYLLTAAYLQNPNDPTLSAHIGFLHIWKVTERQRLQKESPLITNDILLAREYFEDAATMLPNNPIYQGFLGDSMLIQGKVFHNKRDEVGGYFTLKHAIQMWPEFNYFTAGYPMSILPQDSEEFQEALAWQWSTLDLCAGKKVNRQHPDFSPYMHTATQTGSRSACWNSWIAPHNFEGFFMNMGDMLVKTGDWQTAIALYKNARLSSHYKTWPYRGMLEARIKYAKRNVRRFQNANRHAMMFESGRGCVVCHQFS